MGNNTSHLKVEADAVLGAGLPLLDELSLTHRTTGSRWRGRRRLARFTFPRRAWENKGGLQICRAKEKQRLLLVQLQGLDSSTDVTVRCSSGGATFYSASMPFARLLAFVEGAVGGDTALLLLTLVGDEDVAVQGGVVFASLSFTRPTHFLLWSSDDKKESHVSQVDAVSPSHGEGGCGTPASPGQQLQEQEQRGPTHSSEAVGGTTSRKQLTAVEMCPAWNTPPCHKDAAQTCPSDQAMTVTVPGVHCRHPSVSDQDLEVPEIDLGESSSLALYLALHQNDTSLSGQDLPVPQVDLGESSTLAYYLDLHQPEPECCV